MTKRTYGHTRSGRPVDDLLVEQLTDEAEAGYVVDEILDRRGKRGRPRLGDAPSTVESVRLDPDLKARLAQRAADEGVAVSYSWEAGTDKSDRDGGSSRERDAGGLEECAKAHPWSWRRLRQDVHGMHGLVRVSNHRSGPERWDLSVTALASLSVIGARITGGPWWWGAIVGILIAFRIGYWLYWRSRDKEGHE